MKENILKGSSIGFTLAITSILTLRLTNNTEAMLEIFNYFIPILIGYIFFGVSIYWFHNYTPKKKKESVSGVGALYWLFTTFTLIIFVANFLPDYIRLIILTNLIVIITIWYVDYKSLSKIANELNGTSSSKNKTLIIDLKDKPKNKEEFFIELEKYCSQSSISLEYIEKNIPAIVKMNNTINKVELSYYYGYTGIIVYTFKITEL